MNRITLTAVAAATGFVAAAAHAQQPATPPPAPPLVDFSKVEIKTIDLGNRMYMLQGVRGEIPTGGNITVAVTDDGVIMVDGQFAPLHDKVKAAVEAVSKQPIRYLINTHYHGDHSSGNAGFAKLGTVVVAHLNVRNRLAAGSVNGLTGAKVAPVPPEGLPTRTHTGGISLTLKDRSARLMHPVAAHTDGDTYVYFPETNVLATGDTVTMGRYPNIDFFNGGTINGMVAASEAYLKIANDQTKIVPGHGPVATRAQLQEHRDMLAMVRDRLTKLVAEGKTEADVLAAKPLADLDKKWALNEQAGRNFLRAAYNSLRTNW
jgi:cyclase